jgi:hypothetical protein
VSDEPVPAVTDRRYKDSAVRLFGATGMVALKSGICHLKSSEAWSQRSRACGRTFDPKKRGRPRLTHDNLLLHMQHALGQRN